MRPLVGGAKFFQAGERAKVERLPQIGRKFIECWRAGHAIGQGEQFLFQRLPGVGVLRVNARRGLPGDLLLVGEELRIGVDEINAAQNIVMRPLTRAVGDDVLPHHQDAGRCEEEDEGDLKREAMTPPSRSRSQRAHDRVGAILADVFTSKTASAGSEKHKTQFAAYPRRLNSYGRS